jgi:hypothetical protein
MSAILELSMIVSLLVDSAASPTTRQGNKIVST